jgi:ubiquinone/menaquinone biosynthesis C-methylase UbiE
MLDWTGERFVPWAKEAAVAYEHLHRYIWAATLVKDKRVLDLASGEGYGSALLARQASHVCGVDIDDAAIRHASTRYSKANLQFVKGSITNVPIPENQSFDVIVCFEAIEHIEDHEALLSEVKRLLKPGGIFIVSTPNKEYEDDEEENPFHVKELTFQEFDALLTGHFAHVNYLGQRLHPASSLWLLGNANGTAVQEFLIERKGEEFQQFANEKRVARYFIGIVSDVPLTLQAGSVLLDYSDELTRLLMESDREMIRMKESAETSSKWLQGQIDEREAQVRQREGALEWKETVIGQLTSDVGQLTKDIEWSRGSIQELERTVTVRDEALAWRAVQVDDLEKAKIELLTRVQSQADELLATHNELGLRTQELAEIHVSRGWKLLLKLRAMRDKVKGIFGS